MSREPLLQIHPTGSIEEEIRQHEAWIGRVSGLKAEKLLKRTKKTLSFHST